MLKILGITEEKSWVRQIGTNMNVSLKESSIVQILTISKSRNMKQPSKEEDGAFK